MLKLVYLYKRKYREIESLLDGLPPDFVIVKSSVTKDIARSFETACVPALFVFDNSGELRIKREGLALIKDYLLRHQDKNNV